MAQSPPIIQDGILTYLRDGSTAQLVVDSSDWYTWLQTASTFTFHSERGSFTARKERAGNQRGKLPSRFDSVFQAYEISPIPKIAMPILECVARFSTEPHS